MIATEVRLERGVTPLMRQIEERYGGVPIRDLLLAGLRKYAPKTDPHGALANEWGIDRVTVWRWCQRLEIVVITDRRIAFAP